MCIGTLINIKFYINISPNEIEIIKSNELNIICRQYTSEINRHY